MGANFKYKVVWGPMLERILARLDSWKAVLLSKDRRLTPLKSTLVSIPNYYLSLFTIVRVVANDIESKFHKFLWNDSGDQHQYRLID